MTKLDVYNTTGDKVSEIQLNDDVFGIKVNEHAIYEAVKNHLANKRQGTQSTKTRSEVRGGGRKPWRQKGTGRARHGSIRSPLWVGGGIIHAPKPRDYSYRIPKKVRRLAIKSALSSRAGDDAIVVLDELTLDGFSTKKAVEILKSLEIDKKVLVVIDEAGPEVYRSFRNIPGVKVIHSSKINTYDLVNHHTLLVTEKAVKAIEEVYA